MRKFQCIKCKKFFSFNGFYKNKSKPQGRSSICKKCGAKEAKAYYYAHRDSIIKKRRAYVAANPDKVRRQARLYYHKNKQRYNEQYRAYALNYPERIKARNQASYAIKIGRLRAEDCEGCGARKTEVIIEAHHEDYNKPFEVIWLCRSCHRRLHVA